MRLNNELKVQISILLILSEKHLPNATYIDNVFGRRDGTGVDITARGLISFLEITQAPHAEYVKNKFMEFGEEILDVPLYETSKRLSASEGSRDVPHQSAQILKRLVTYLSMETLEDVNTALQDIFIAQAYVSNPLYTYLRGWLAEDIRDTVGVNISLARQIRPDFKRGVFNISWDKVRDADRVLEALTLYTIKSRERNQDKLKTVTSMKAFKNTIHFPIEGFNLVPSSQCIESFEQLTN